jgi:MFS family permease
MSLSQRLDILRLRNYRNLFLGETVSVIGDGLFPVAITFAVLDLTGSATDVGLVLASSSLPMVIFALVGGVWADRLRREWVMIASDLVRAAAAFAGAALLIGGQADVWSLCVMSFVYGTADAFFFPAYGALIPQLVPDDRLQEANALRGMSDSFGWFVGPAMAGALVATIGSGGAIAIDGITFLVSAGFLLTLRVPPLVRTLRRERFTAELKHGWHEVRSRTWLWTMMLRAMLVLFVTIAPLQVLGPLALTDRGYGAGQWGLLTGLFSLGMIFGGAAALYLRPRRPMVLIALCGTSACVPLAALAIGASLPVLYLVWILRGVTIGLFVAIWEATLQREIAGESLARVTAWDWMTASALWPLGLILAGPAAEAVGVTTACWVSAGFGLVFSLWVLAVKDVWRLRARPLAPPAAPAAASGVAAAFAAGPADDATLDALSRPSRTLD